MTKKYNKYIGRGPKLQGLVYLNIRLFYFR